MFTTWKRFTTLRSPGAQSFLCWSFLFTKMQQGLTSIKRRCVFICHCFLQVSLFVDVYKKQATQKNNQVTQLWVVAHRLRTTNLEEEENLLENRFLQNNSTYDRSVKSPKNYNYIRNYNYGCVGFKRHENK